MHSSPVPRGQAWSTWLGALVVSRLMLQGPGWVALLLASVT